MSGFEVVGVLFALRPIVKELVSFIYHMQKDYKGRNRVMRVYPTALKTTLYLLELEIDKLLGNTLNDEQLVLDFRKGKLKQAEKDAARNAIKKYLGDARYRLFCENIGDLYFEVKELQDLLVMDSESGEAILEKLKFAFFGKANDAKERLDSIEAIAKRISGLLSQEPTGHQRRDRPENSTEIVRRWKCRQIAAKTMCDSVVQQATRIPQRRIWTIDFFVKACHDRDLGIAPIDWNHQRSDFRGAVSVHERWHKSEDISIRHDTGVESGAQNLLRPLLPFTASTHAINQFPSKYIATDSLQNLLSDLSPRDRADFSESIAFATLELVSTRLLGRLWSLSNLRIFRPLTKERTFWVLPDKPLSITLSSVNLLSNNGQTVTTNTSKRCQPRYLAALSLAVAIAQLAIGESCEPLLDASAAANPYSIMTQFVDWFDRTNSSIKTRVRQGVKYLLQSFLGQTPAMDSDEGCRCITSKVLQVLQDENDYQEDVL